MLRLSSALAAAGQVGSGEPVQASGDVQEDRVRSHHEVPHEREIHHLEDQDAMWAPLPRLERVEDPPPERAQRLGKLLVLQLLAFPRLALFVERGQPQRLPLRGRQRPPGRRPLDAVGAFVASSMLGARLPLPRARAPLLLASATACRPRGFLLGGARGRVGLRAVRLLEADAAPRVASVPLRRRARTPGDQLALSVPRLAAARHPGKSSERGGAHEDQQEGQARASACHG
mmetsp:Transcript_2722/g.7485  ORF Transcript_2722/g.7485 Transcript_2722/m.7485 type:complete len:231 (-) Transcript_2722:21-713(-)